MELLHICSSCPLCLLLALLLPLLSGGVELLHQPPPSFLVLPTNDDTQEANKLQNSREEAETPPGEWGPNLSHQLGFEAHQRQRKTDELLEQLEHYEIVVPSRVDRHGNFITHDVSHIPRHSKRYRRSIPDFLDRKSNTDNTSNEALHTSRDIKELSETISTEHHADAWIYYKLTAFGRDFILNLTHNSGLFAPQFSVEYRNGSGVSSRHVERHDCHYIGHVVDDRRPDSRAALSNCHGLHGVFGAEEEDFFVEPLWNATNDVTSSEHQHHVVFRRSSIKSKHTEDDCGVHNTSPRPHPRQLDTPWALNQLLKPHHHGYHYKDKYRENKRRRGKRSLSSEKYVETVVVVDRRMVNYHGREAIEPYVLTVMNIVAKLYRDASIGNLIYIVVSRIIVLTADQPQLTIDHHADTSLESFCRWQQTVNPPQNSVLDKNLGLSHHDNAVLITRIDICSYKNEPCGTLGLAPVGGMCDPARSCSITEDIGLASAFTIAHEIGHNFDMQHDGSHNRCGRPGEEPSRIMASQLSRTRDAFSWSSCSRAYITRFLDSGEGICLDNPPPAVDLAYSSQLPGHVYDARQQCQYKYGHQSRVCKYKQICQRLWCTDTSGECRTSYIPAADGTTCNIYASRTGWCYKGKCVRNNYQPTAVDGGWARWSRFGPCSCTCGGGVMSSIRSCNNPSPENGGKYCVGERKRYRTCNVQDCPLNAEDFRELQCKSYNMVQYRGKYFKWKSYSGVGNTNPCALNCMAVGYNFYTEKAPKVADGTRCLPDSYDMCIDGQCRRVGCDYLIGSEAAEDQCRVCGGNSSTCETISATITEPFAEFIDNYKPIVKIPQGAVHITVVETAISNNYLALKSDDGRYYINGKWTIDWPRKFVLANTVFHYERPRDAAERLYALGPTSEDLVIVLLLQEENPGISYQYNMPVSNVTYNASDYDWQLTPWSPCSRSCAGGTSSSKAVCVRISDAAIVDSDLCLLHLRPNDRMNTCNSEPCEPQWTAYEWTECSVTCGGGIKTRVVKCLQTVSEMDTRVRAYNECLSDQPASSMKCNIEDCPTLWAAGEWSPCRSTCGPSVRSRLIYCVSPEGTYLPFSACNPDTRPARQEPCNLRDCPRPQWRIGSWSLCSAACGSGVQMRAVTCRSHLGHKSTKCDPQLRPDNLRSCEGACLHKTKHVCQDRKKVAYCPLVLRYNHCTRSYFRKMCCKTCADNGF